MYTVLIADDESIIRQGLIRLIDWEDLGFSVIGEAETGESALSQMLRLSPDIVLMDIRMPGIPGLEAVRQARQSGYTGRIIILSGYSDFSYAQEAIRQGIEYYLTKPVDEDELVSILSDIKRQLDERIVASDAAIQYQKKAHDAVIFDLLSGQLDPSFLQLSDFHLKADRYQVIFSDNFNLKADPIRTGSSFADLMGAVLDDANDYDIIRTDHYEVLLLKGGFAISRFAKLLAHYMSDVAPERNSLLDSFFIACGKCVDSFDEIPQSYQSAHAAMQRRFFCVPGQHTIITDGNTPPSPQNPPLQAELSDRAIMSVQIDSADKAASEQPVPLDEKMLHNFSKRLLDDTQAFNRPLLDEALKDLSAQLTASMNTAEAVRLFLVDLYLQIKEQMNVIYSDVSIPFPNNATIIRSINDASYLYEIISFLSDQLLVMMNAIDNFDRKSILDNVTHYIERNYASQLTLDGIAPLYGYNSSYLGKILGQHLGTSFNNYLDQIRIEHAKDLLRNTNMKVYLIGERIGYRSVDYFHIKFKKIVNMSPAEYRKSHRKD